MTVRSVLLTAPRCAPYPGGVETHVAALADALARRGMTVTVVSGADTPQVTVEHRGPVTHRLVPQRSRSWLLPPAGWAAAVADAAAGVDVVHIHSYHQPHAVVAARTISAATPVVFTPHFHGGGHTWWSRPAHPLWRTVARPVIERRVGHVIAVSAPEQELFTATFPAAPVTVIPNGTVPPPAAAPWPRPEPVVLTVSRLERYKRIDRLVAAVAGRPLRLVVVGAGPDRSRLERVAGRTGAHVEVAGRVDDATLHRWWATAAVYATVSDHEAFGLGLATALVAAVPAVASPIPAHRWVAELAGVDVAWDTGDVDRLGALLETAAATRPTAGLLPTWDDVAAATVDVYETAAR